MTLGKDILLLVLGWIFGLFSSIIVDWLKERSQRKELKQGLFTELKALRFRLIATVGQIAFKFGSFDRELLSWLRQQYENYGGAFPKERVLQSIDNLLKSGDKQLAIDAEIVNAPPGNVLSLKAFNFPFLDSQISNLSLFDAEFQNRILEIKTQVNFINEDIELSRFYFEKTFDSSITEENHEIISKNLKNAYQDVGEKACRIVDSITKLIST